MLNLSGVTVPLYLFIFLTLCFSGLHLPCIMINKSIDEVVLGNTDASPMRLQPLPKFTLSALEGRFCPAQAIRRCYISGDASKPPARCMGPVIFLSWCELTQGDSTNVWTPHHNRYISRKQPRAEDSDFNYCWNMCISHVLPFMSRKVKEQHKKFTSFKYRWSLSVIWGCKGGIWSKNKFESFRWAEIRGNFES